MGIKIISENRKARFDYHILDTYEAGIVLRGSEVKSMRAGQCQLKDSYVDFHNGELFLINMHISEYKQSSYNNPVPERRRKLLMSRSEINKMYARIREKGFTCVPLKIYFKEGWAKVEVALVKSKKDFDKRDVIKTRDVNRNLAQTMRKSRSSSSKD
jgi:SsrA-binding protein